MNGAFGDGGRSTLLNFMSEWHGHVRRLIYDTSMRKFEISSMNFGSTNFLKENL